MPNESSLSISRIRDFDQCPYKFHKNAQPAHSGLPETMAVAFAEWFRHFVDQHFTVGERISESFAIDKMVAEAAFLAHFWPRGELRPDVRLIRLERQHNYIEKLHHVLNRLNTIIREAIAGQTITSKRQFATVRYNGIEVTSTLDLITSDTNDRKSIWVWKTGRPDRSPATDGARCMLLWSWGKARFGTVAEIRMMYLTTKDAYSQSYSDSLMRNTFDWLVRRQAEITGTTKFPTKKSRLCDWCEWQPQCPAHERQV
jgi:hypothetical protein